MKILFISILTVLLFGNAQSQTYYLDPINGSDDYTPSQAQTISKPWKSFNAIKKYPLIINAGTRFKLKSGQYGPEITSLNGIPMTLEINSEKGWQGTADAPIVIEGQDGQTPVFTTYKTAKNPLPVAGKRNVFAYVVDVFEELSVVEIDGHPRACGRWPKRTETNDRGYLMGRVKTGGGYQETSTITANFIPSYNLVGGDVVIRNSDYIVSVHPITGQTANSIDFFNMAEPGIEEGFGTYFQNHLNLLSANYEWAHKRGATDTLYVYFADGKPEKHTVRYASSNLITWVLKGQFIQFKGIKFEGANVHAVKLQITENIQFESCEFKGAGRKAIWQVNSATSTVVRNSTVKHCFAGGFDLGAEANSIIENNILDSISIFNTRPTRNADLNNGELRNNQAEGLCGDAAIIAQGHSSKINGNQISYAGFNGINWNGASTLVNGNFINYVQLRGKDGGGIYSFNKGLPDYTKEHVRTISNNTILNVVGDPGGTVDNTYSPVFGIYNDDEVNKVNISNNTIAYVARAGIYNHHTQYIAASGNVIFNCEYGYYTRYGDNNSTKLPVENTFTGDLVVSNAAGQIRNSFTVLPQGAFASIQPDQTATLSNVDYFPYDEKQERVLIYNPFASASSISYSGGPYKNILTNGVIGSSPLRMNGYTSFIGYRAFSKKTGVSEQTNESAAQVFNGSVNLTLAPNPVSTALSINCNGNTDPMTVSLFDITGRKLIANAKFTTNYQLDFSNHQKGAYIVLLTNVKNSFQERRVIIKK